MRLIRLLYFLGFQDEAGSLESWLFRRRLKRLAAALSNVARGAASTAKAMQDLAGCLR